MRFFKRRKRSTPTVIIIALIDVLIVLLIFLMVTTTVRNQPSVRLALPEARQAQEGATPQHLVLTIEADAPQFYLGMRPVTFDRLQQELRDAVADNPQVSLSLNADGRVHFDRIVQVMDAARAAGINSINAFVRQAAN